MLYRLILLLSVWVHDFSLRHTTHTAGVWWYLWQGVQRKYKRFKNSTKNYDKSLKLIRNTVVHLKLYKYILFLFLLVINLM